jgi:hypothetical protein
MYTRPQPRTCSTYCGRTGAPRTRAPRRSGGVSARTRYHARASHAGAQQEGHIGSAQQAHESSSHDAGRLAGPMHRRAAHRGMHRHAGTHEAGAVCSARVEGRNGTQHARTRHASSHPTTTQMLKAPCNLHVQHNESVQIRTDAHALGTFACSAVQCSMCGVCAVCGSGQSPVISEPLWRTKRSTAIGWRKSRRKERV